MNNPPIFFRCDSDTDVVKLFEAGIDIMSNLDYAKESAITVAQLSSKPQVIYKLVLIPVYRVDCVTTYPVTEYAP